MFRKLSNIINFVNVFVNIFPEFGIKYLQTKIMATAFVHSVITPFLDSQFNI